MSSLVVEVCDVKRVYPHPNADALEFITVKGWPVLVQKSLGLKPGDLVVYFPPDTVMSRELADRLGIAKYLSELPKESDGSRPPGLRVRAARLRGEASYGTIDHVVAPDWHPGQDVAAHYGVTKFDPPQPTVDGDSLPRVEAFHSYTEIENIRNYPDVIRPEEEVVITEKIHGKNCRMGIVRVGDGWEWMAGSHAVRRKPLDAKGRPSDFWTCLTGPVRDLLSHLCDDARNVILFGEIYGSGIQDMSYGYTGGAKGFCVFDISVDGAYLGHEAKHESCRAFGVSQVPILYRGPFSWEAVETYTYGDTLLCSPDQAGRFRGREGCVITPVRERYDPALGGSGRVILKSISADYLSRKGGSDAH